MPKSRLTRDSINNKRSQTFRKRNHRKTLEQVVESSPATGFLSAFRSKLVGGRHLKVLINNIRKKVASGADPQIRLVKCPKCRKILHEPVDVPSYRCGGCGTVLQAEHWKTDRKVVASLDETDGVQANDESIPEAVVLSSGECSLDRNNKTRQKESADSITEQVSALKLSNEEQLGYYASGDSTSRETLTSRDFSSSSGTKSPMNKIYRGYDRGVLSHIGRDEHFVPQATPRRDKFPMINDSAMHMQARNSPNSVHGQPIRNWIRQERHDYLSATAFYPSSPSPSSMYGSNSPFHQSYSSTADQRYQDINYLGHYGGHRWAKESTSSPMHFSGEIFDGRHYQYSAQSPLSDFRHQGFYGHSSYDSYSSCTATPQRSMYSEYYPMTESYVQMDIHNEVKKYARERIHVVKRHLRPTANGAPFVACYYCLELLQLPQDFLVLKRRWYLLRCGGCSGVLKFSLRDKTRTVPYTPLLLDSPPSHSGDISVDNQDLASNHNGNGCSNEDPASCSDDDCVGSIWKSSSTDGDLVCLDPSHDFPGDIIAKNISDDSSEVILETPEFHLKQAENEREVLRETLGSGETVGETSRTHLEQSQNEYENPREILESDEFVGGGFRFSLEKTRDEKSETLEPGKTIIDGSVEDTARSKTLQPTETMGETQVFNFEVSLSENENSSEKLESADNMGDGGMIHLKESKKVIEHVSETTADRPGLHLEEYETKYQCSGETLEPGDAMDTRSMFHLEESENESEDSKESLEQDEEMTERLMLHIELSQEKIGNSREVLEPGETVQERALSISREDRPGLLLEEYETMHQFSHEIFKPGEAMDTRSMFHLEESENESEGSNESLEQDKEMAERLMFQLELSQNNLGNSREVLEPVETVEERSFSFSRQSPNEYEHTEEAFESGVETTGDSRAGVHVEPSQNDIENSRKILDLNTHFYDTIDPSEIVGLRQAIYPMQGSPLRSPLSSPIHTPVGSPLRYPIGSPLRSPVGSPLHHPIGSPLRSAIVSPLRSPVGSPLHHPIGSPLRSAIVSPLRSPVGSPFSLANGLFLGN